MADVDELQIKINAEATKANNAIDRLVGKLDRLTTSLSRVNGTNLNGLANGVQRLGNAMQVMNTIKTADFTRLATNLTKLGSVNVSALNSAASSMSHLTRAFNSLGTVSDNAQAVGEMAKNISKLGNKSVQTAITNIPQLAKAVNNLMTTLSKSPKVSQNVIKMTNALANMASQVSKVGGASKSVVTGLNKTSASADKAKKSFSGLAYAFGKFYANFFLIIRGFKQLGNAIENSMNYVETYNYFNVALDKIAKEFSKSYERFGYDNAEDYANSFTSRLAELNEKMTGYKLGEDGELIDTGKIGLGLDPRQIMSFQANIASVTNSVGLLGETSINSAKGLSMLAQDLSSLFNVDLKTTMQNLASGLIGQSRALYKYGIDITNATLQQIAYANGVTKSVSAMTQAEKMQLRLIAILQQSKVAWTDSIQTINTAANQFRILKQQIANLSRTIGNLFLPIVQKILPVISGLVIAINRLLTGLGVKLFGADWLKNLNKDTSQGSSEFVDLGDAIEDTDDSMQEAQKSAEKLKRSLMGFDEINQLSPKTDDTDTGTNLGNVGGVDLTDTIGDLLAEYEDAWNKAFEKMVNDAEKWADRIEEIFKRPEEAGRKLNKALTNALNSIPWDSIYEGARNFGTGLAQFLNGLISPDLFYAVGRTIANSLNTAIYTALSFGETFDWSNLGESIASGINGFFENFDAKSLAKAINKWVNGLFKMVLTALTNIKWGTIAKRIAEFIGNLDISTIAIVIGAVTIKKIAKMQLAKTVLSQLSKAIQADISKALVAKFGAESTSDIGHAIWSWIKKSTTKGSKSNAEEISKTLVGNISTSTSSAFAGLSNTLKFSIGGAGILAEATLVKRAFQTIAEQGKLTSGSIAEIATGAGVALGALKIVGMLNPFTALIAGATGLAGAIIGIKQSFDEADFNAHFELMKNIGGVTMQELGERAKTAFGNIVKGSEDVKNSISAIEETEESITGTINNINLMREAINKGAYTASEKIPQIIEQMQKLLSDSKTIFNEEYDVIIKGLCGSLGEALEAAGFSTSEIATNLAIMKANGDESIGGLEQKLKDLYVQFENGAISAEEFSNQSAPVIEALQRINADNATDSIVKFSEALDVAKYTTANGFDTGTFEADIAQVGDALANARNLVDTNADGIKDSIERFKNGLEALGTDTSGVDWAAMLNCNEQTVAETKAQLDRAMLEYSDKIQEGLINQIPAVVEDATADYKELSPFRKLFTSEDDYVAKRINEWKQNTLNPASESIKQSMEQLGIDGAEWSKEAASKIINEMYDTTTETSYEGVEITTSKLKSNYKEIIDKSMGGLSETMKQYGKDSVDGYNNGIEEGKSRTESIMQKFSDWIKNAFHDSSLRFGSPSETMKQYGQWTDEGFNIGVESKRSVILNTLSDFANDIILKFKNGIADIPLISRDVFSKARDIISDSLDRIKNLFNFTWRLPDIKLPHFSISGSFSLNPPSVPSFGIDWYANGGFPEDGLFMANHNELVGKFSNGKTAVANNEQIIQGIQNGVASAITNAVVPYLVQIVNKDTTLQIDGREIGRTSVNYINQEKRRGAEPLIGY